MIVLADTQISDLFPAIGRLYHYRGISAVGSASHWQCGGQGFKSPMLHQKSRHKRGGFFHPRKIYRNPYYCRKQYKQKEILFAASAGSAEDKQEKYFF